MFWRTLIFLCVFVFPAVVTAETRVDFNRSKNFSQYKTFTLEVSPPVRNGEVDEHNTIAENRLRNAAAYALRMHGLTQVESGGDVVVRVKNREDERTEVYYPYGWYGPWGYGYGGYWGGYGGYWGAPYGGGYGYTYTYYEGTTTFDVMERATGDLVYRAEVSKKVDDDEEDLDHDAIKIARKAFKKYPTGGVFVDD